MPYSKILSIHGAPRSGTSWLGQLFSSSPKIRFKFQPFYSYAFRDKLNMDDDTIKTRAFFDALYASNEAYLDRQDQIATGIYPKFDEKETDPPFLSLKSVKYHYLAPKFLRELDDFEMIAIIRNPKAAINSFLNAPREFDPSLNRLAEWRFAQTRNDFRPEYYYGFHRWVECNMLFLEMKKRYPQRVHLLKYNALAKDTKAVLGELFDTLGVPMHQQTLDFIRASSETFQDDPYSVFRGKQDSEGWKKMLEKEIQDAIDKDILGTPLAEYLE